MFQPLQELSDVYGQLQAAAAAMVKISSVLDAEPEIGDRPGAAPIGPIEGAIDLDGVRFAYGETDVLHGITSTCRPAAASRWSARPAAASRRWPS